MPAARLEQECLSNLNKTWRQLLSGASLAGSQTTSMDHVMRKKPLREIDHHWKCGAFGCEEACELFFRALTQGTISAS